MRRETSEALAELGSRVLRSLLTGLESAPDSYWHLVADNPDHRPRISRAAAQLIESVSWLDCQEDAFRRIENLAQFLTQQSAVDPENIAFTASRLKSILQFCAYERAPFCEYDAMCNSLEYLVSLRLTEAGTKLYDQLCVTDLFGYFLSLSHASPYGANLDRNNLSQRVQDSYTNLLAAVREWTAHFKRPEEDPKDFSFSLWLLFLGDHYGARNGALSDARFLSDLRTLKSATDSYDNSFRLRKPYKPEHFSKIVFPKLILAWFNRKTTSEGACFDLEDFYQWLVPVAHRLIEEDGDPYHLGIILKVCIAAVKDDLRQRFREASLDASLELIKERARREQEDARTFLSQIIRDRLSVTIDRNERLTGGWTAAQVWRVTGRYVLPLRSQAHGESPLEQFSFVVKTGPRDRFIRAASLYAALGPTGRSLFPSHDPEPSVVLTASGPTFYLIMQELRDYRSVGGRILSLIPRDKTAALPLREIREVAGAGLDAIRKLHAVHDSDQLWNQARPRPTQVKIAEIFSLVEDIRHKSGRLSLLCGKPIVYREGAESLQLSNVRDLTKKALNLVGRIVVAEGAKRRHSIVHGDCHAHNIMVPRETARQPLFVDIDGLAIDDYLQDYAEFIAHACFSLDLEAISDEEVEIEVREEEGRCEAEAGYRSVRIWEVQRAIYDQCIEAARSEAAQREDKGALKRLHLLLANRLLFIAARSVREAKAMIPFLRGLACLQSVCRVIEGVSAQVPVPLTLIEIVLDPETAGRPQ